MNKLPKTKESKTHAIKLFVVIGPVRMDGHTYRNKQCDEEPVETDYSICHEIRVPGWSPQNNYKSINCDGLGNYRVNSA